MRMCRPVNGLPCDGSVSVSSGKLAEAVDRVEEQLECIGLGLDLVDADIGRDARQHHVAADQQVQRVAVQRDMFRRMAVAADAAPLAAADGQQVAVGHAAVLRAEHSAPGWGSSGCAP